MSTNSPQDFNPVFISNAPVFASHALANIGMLFFDNLKGVIVMPEMNPDSDHSALPLKTVLYPSATVALTITGYDYTWSKKRS